MNILVLSATPMEIQPLVNACRKNNGSFHSPDILIGGIGLTATSYSLMKQFTIKKPRLVIQTGVGGCFDKKILLGEVVAVKKETIADQSVVELKKLKTLFDLRLLPQNRFPYSRGWLVNDHPLLAKLKLKKVSGISVNEITTAPGRIKFYREKFNPVIESMEGAALHFVGLMEKVPFLQLRAVSNYIGERKKKKWNMRESIANLNDELISLLTQLTN